MVDAGAVAVRADVEAPDVVSMVVDADRVVVPVGEAKTEEEADEEEGEKKEEDDEITTTTTTMRREKKRRDVETAPLFATGGDPLYISTPLHLYLHLYLPLFLHVYPHFVITVTYAYSYNNPPSQFQHQCHDCRGYGSSC